MSQGIVNIDRRGFLKGLGVVGAGVAGAGLYGSSAAHALAPRPVSAPAGRVSLWNDPSSWPNGKVPGKGDIAVVDRPILLSGVAEVAGVRIEPTGTLQLAPTVTSWLRSSGNVVVRGALVLRPASAEVEHKITFVDVDETRFVGGDAHEPIDSDVGLWVVEGGVLDAVGTPKTAWSRLSDGAAKGTRKLALHDASGWQAGDRVVVTPTVAPAADTSSTAHALAYDDGTVAAVAGGSVTLGAALAQPHPAAADSFGNRWTPEVLNLTRNVVIEGTDKGRAHILFVATTRPQRLRDVELRHLGPAGVLGRYPLHFHRAGSASQGTTVSNVVAHDCGNHAFVPHSSHGITFEGCVAHDVVGTPFWWDPTQAETAPEPTDGITFRACVASLVHADEELPVQEVADPAPFHCEGLDIVPTSDGAVVTVTFRDEAKAIADLESGALTLTLTGAPATKEGPLSWRVTTADNVLLRFTATMQAIDQNGKKKKVVHPLPAWVQRKPYKVIKLTEGNLQRQIDQAPNGSELIGTGTYQGPVNLRDRHGLVLRNIKLAIGEDRGWNLEGSSSITFEDCSVEGSHTEADGGYVPYAHGFAINGSHQIRLARCSVKGAWGDFVYVGSEINKGGHGLFSNIPSHDVLVESCDFYSCGRQGFGITSADRLRILDCTAGDIGRSLIDIEPGHVFDPVRSVSIDGLRLTGNVRNNFLAMHGSAYHVQNIEVTNAQLGVHSPIRVSVTGNSQRRGLRLHNLVSEAVLGNPHAAVTVAGWEDVEVTDCRGWMQSDRGSPFVRLENCYGYRIEGNSTKDSPRGNKPKQAQGHTVEAEIAWWQGHRSEGDPYRVVHLDRGQHNVVVGAAINPDPEHRPGAEPRHGVAGFYLGTCTPGANVAESCVAVGVTGEESSGFCWPGLSQAVWTFSGNIAHNNANHGLLAWQDTDSVGVVSGAVAYHNGAAGILHGGAANLWRYEDCDLYGNRGAGIEVHAVSRRTSGTEKVYGTAAHPLLTFRRLRVDGAGLSTDGFRSRRHRFGARAGMPALVEDCDVRSVTRTSFAMGPWDTREEYELVDCRFTAPALHLHPAMNPTSVGRVRNLNGDGKTYQVWSRSSRQPGAARPEWGAAVVA